MYKTIKKGIFSIIFVFLAIFAFRGTADASTTVSFDSSEIKTNLNGDFSVKVYVNSLGSSRDYTVRTALRFSGEQLDIKSWELANNWMPLLAEGYDLIDNEEGLFVKTAGYPGGWSGKVLLGTITFNSKQSSIAKIEVSNQTFSLDENGDNVFTDGEEVKVTVLNSNGTMPTKSYTLPLESDSRLSIYN